MEPVLNAQARYISEPNVKICPEMGKQKQDIEKPPHRSSETS